MTPKVVGTERGMWPVKTLLLPVRKAINNRNCRVRASKTLTEQGLRRGVSQDGSSLQNQGHQQVQKGYPIFLPCAQSHKHPSTFPRQEARERGSENLCLSHPWLEQNRDCIQSCRVQTTNTVPPSAGTASQGTQRSLGLERSLGSVDAITRVHAHTGFYKSAPHPRPLSSALTPSVSCPLQRCHHHALPESQRRDGGS